MNIRGQSSRNRLNCSIALLHQDEAIDVFFSSPPPPENLSRYGTCLVHHATPRTPILVARLRCNKYNSKVERLEPYGIYDYVKVTNQPVVGTSFCLRGKWDKTRTVTFNLLHSVLLSKVQTPAGKAGWDWAIS